MCSLQVCSQEYLGALMLLILPKILQLHCAATFLWRFWDKLIIGCLKKNGPFLANCWVVLDIAGWRKDCKLLCFCNLCGRIVATMWNLCKYSLSLSLSLSFSPCVFRGNAENVVNKNVAMFLVPRASKTISICDVVCSHGVKNNEHAACMTISCFCV